MVDLIQSLDRNEIAQKIKDIKKKHKDAVCQYSTCPYILSNVSKVWHCVLVTWDE